MKYSNGDENKIDWLQNRRCWDGKFGCEQVKPIGGFVHPRLCQSCCALYAARYGGTASDIQILLLLLWEEDSMVKQCLAMGMEKDRVIVLHKSSEVRIKTLYGMMLSAWRNKETQAEVPRLMTMYRREIYTLAGVEPNMEAKEKARIK